MQVPHFSADSPDAAERFAARLTRDSVASHPPTAFMSSFTDMTVPWHESTEMYWNARNCGVRAKHLVYTTIGHGEFVVDWAPVRRGGVVGAALESGDLYEGLQPFQRDLVEIVSGRVVGMGSLP